MKTVILSLQLSIHVRKQPKSQKGPPGKKIKQTENQVEEYKQLTQNNGVFGRITAAKVSQHTG